MQNIAWMQGIGGRIVFGMEMITKGGNAFLPFIFAKMECLSVALGIGAKIKNIVNLAETLIIAWGNLVIYSLLSTLVHFCLFGFLEGEVICIIFEENMTLTNNRKHLQ